MICPACQADRTAVIDTRPMLREGLALMVRRRRCGECYFKFRTVEVDLNDWTNLVGQPEPAEVAE